MYPRSFLCEEAKIKQRTPLKKELCEIGEEAIWESRFTSFFNWNAKKYSISNTPCRMSLFSLMIFGLKFAGLRLTIVCFKA